MPRRHGVKLFKKTIRTARTERPASVALSNRTGIKPGTPTTMRLSKGRGSNKFERRVGADAAPGAKIERKNRTVTQMLLRLANIGKKNAGKEQGTKNSRPPRLPNKRKR